MAALEAGIAPFVRVPANTPDYIIARARRRRARRSSRRTSARPPMRARWSRPPSSRRWASARTPAGCRTCTTAASRRRTAYAALNDATMVIVQFESAAALGRRGDRGGRRRRHGADRHQRSAGRLGHSRPVRRSTRARGLCAGSSPPCRRHGKHCGVGGLAHAAGPDGRFVSMGARYVSTGTDLGFLSAPRAAASRCRSIELTTSR